MSKFAVFVLFEGHLDAEAVVIGAWTLYEVREDMRRAFGNNRYVDPKAPWYRKRPEMVKFSVYRVQMFGIL